MQSGYQVKKMDILIHFDSQNRCKKNRMKKKKFIVMMKEKEIKECTFRIRRAKEN